MKLVTITLLTTILLCACGSAQTKEEVSSEVKAADENPVQATLRAFDGKEIIPLKYKTVYVHNFDNRGFDGNVVGRLKEILQIKLNLDGRLKVEAEKKKADVWLYGTIERYTMVPAGYDRFRQPTQYLLTAVVSIKVRANDPEAEADTLLDSRVVRFDTAFTPRQPPYETEFVAKERLLDTLCDRIVHTMFEGWYSDMKTDLELGYDKKASENSELIRGRKQKKETAKTKEDDMAEFIKRQKGEKTDPANSDGRKYYDDTLKKKDQP